MYIAHYLVLINNSAKLLQSDVVAVSFPIYDEFLNWAYQKKLQLVRKGEWNVHLAVMDFYFMQ